MITLGLAFFIGVMMVPEIAIYPLSCLALSLAAVIVLWITEREG